MYRFRYKHTDIVGYFGTVMLCTYWSSSLPQIVQIRTKLLKKLGNIYVDSFFLNMA